MELRPVRTALLAGRAASRWAASTSSTTTTSRPSTSIPLSLYVSNFPRSFSSTRFALQEAEATAPVASDMTTYMKERAQQREEQQRRQQQPQSTPSVSPQQKSSQNSIFARSPTSSTSATSPSDFRQPWANRRSNAQIVPHNNRLSMNGVNDILADLNLDKFNLQPTAADIEKQKEAMFYEKPIDVKYRLRPVIGRTVNLASGADVDVGRRVDFAMGLARLEMQCRANRVKSDATKQKFHERKGLKKKRLRSERWQRRFMEGFKATCKRVNELAKQGW